VEEMKEKSGEEEESKLGDQGSTPNVQRAQLGMSYDLFPIKS